MPPHLRVRRARAILLTLAAALTTLALAAQANAAGTTINVNGATGNDTNPATTTAPLKTLTKALKLAHAGDTIKLAAGVYGPGLSGDQFPAGGLVVPSGVTITGATSSGFPTTTLVGPGNGAALRLAGNATVRNLTFGGSGFGVGVFANQGKQTLSNLLLGTPAAQPAVIDGIPLRGGLFLRGSANATLTAGTIFLQFNNATGVSVNEQARFTMDGGTITGGSPNCNSGVTGIELNQAAQATLKNINNLKDATAGILNIAGTALAMRGTSQATVSDSFIQRDLTAGCQPRPSVTVDKAAALTVVHSVMLQRTSGAQANAGTGIAMGSSAPLALPANANGFGTSIGGYAKAIEVISGGTGSLTLDSTSFTTCRICVDGGGASGAVAITNSSFRSGLAGSVGVIAPKPRVRGTEFVGSGTGIVVTATGADLGTASDPGNNEFHQFTTGVRVDIIVNTAFVRAEGNTWEPNIQGADATGHYTKTLFVSGASSFAKGVNFDVQQDGQQRFGVGIDLASTPVGRLRLAPHALRVRAGKTADLQLSWTHPRAWRELRKIELRLYRGATQVAMVALRPHGERLTADGAITLGTGSRVTHSGKTVTARLALRLSRSLAGKRLRVAVTATDRHGHRQLEPNAGRIGVTR